MKKIFPITFLIIVLFNVVGYFIVFKVEQFQIKAEIKSEIRAGIHSEALVKITLNKSDIQSIEWTESDEEFRYKDNLYDVVKFSETENTITYYCVKDVEEESLFASLTDHIDTHVAGNSPQKSSKKLNKHVIKLYFINNQELPIALSDVSSANFSVDQIITSTIQDNNTPPPEFV